MPRQILALLDILRTSDWKRRDFVESRHRETARNFSATVGLLERLGWVEINAEEIRPVPAWMERIFGAEADNPNVQMLEGLMDCPGPHRTELMAFLNRFELHDGVPACSLLGEASIELSEARNFLMELGAVSRPIDSPRYALEEAFAGAFVTARALRTPRTRALSQLLQEDREDLGRRAEFAVLDFERSRVGARWAARVRHISSEHPLACYDIQSISVGDDGNPLRYIEVKAVSPESGEFYWSEGEIEAAHALRGRYYLYLIPALGSGEFDLTGLKMISDPFVSVYQNGDHWTKQPTHFLCRPVRPTTS